MGFSEDAQERDFVFLVATWGHCDRKWNQGHEYIQINVGSSLSCLAMSVKRTEKLYEIIAERLLQK